MRPNGAAQPIMSRTTRFRTPAVSQLSNIRRPHFRQWTDGAVRRLWGESATAGNKSIEAIRQQQINNQTGRRKAEPKKRKKIKPQPETGPPCLEGHRTHPDQHTCGKRQAISLFQKAGATPIPGPEPATTKPARPMPDEKWHVYRSLTRLNTDRPVILKNQQPEADELCHSDPGSAPCTTRLLQIRAQADGSSSHAGRPRSRRSAVPLLTIFSRDPDGTRALRIKTAVPAQTRRQNLFVAVPRSIARDSESVLLDFRINSPIPPAPFCTYPQTARESEQITLSNWNRLRLLLYVSSVPASAEQADNNLHRLGAKRDDGQRPRGRPVLPCRWKSQVSKQEVPSSRL